MRGEGVGLGSLCSCSLTVGLVVGGGGPSLNGWVSVCLSLVLSSQAKTIFRSQQ